MVSARQAEKLQLGQLLVAQGEISPEQLQSALARQADSGHKLLLGEVIVQMGMCTEEQIMNCVARGYGLPFVRVSPKVADPKVIQLLPRPFVEKHVVLPLFKVRGMLTLAVHEPSNVFLMEEVARITGCTVQAVCATARDIHLTLETHMPSANVFVIDDILEDVGSGNLDLVEELVEDISDLETAAGHSPVIKLVNYLVAAAVRENASDVHVEPDEGSVRIRFRVDGRLFEKMRLPAKMLPAIVSRIKIMARLDISERRLPQDGGIHVLMDARPIDLRISTMAASHGEKVVMRIIDNRNILVNLERLGFSYETLKSFRAALESPNGVVLVTGPTGSGKSTTLYAVLAEVAADERVQPGGHQPVPGQRKDRFYLCHGPPQPVAAGPRRDHGGRDSRSGDRHHRRAVRIDGPPRLLHAAHQRRPRRHHAAAEPGRRAVPGGRLAAGGAGPAAGAENLPALPRTV
jgi:type IV pilus assembly protein PilB